MVVEMILVQFSSIVIVDDTVLVVVVLWQSHVSQRLPVEPLCGCRQPTSNNREQPNTTTDTTTRTESDETQQLCVRTRMTSLWFGVLFSLSGNGTLTTTIVEELGDNQCLRFQQQQEQQQQRID